MNKELIKSLRIALIFIASGLFLSLFVFLLLFGKGLQILLPIIMLPIFFIVFLLFEKVPFIARKPILKAVLTIVIIIAAIILI